MKPGFAQMLIALAQVQGGRVIPALPEGSYATGDAGMVIAMLALMAQHVDGAADLLARENAALRALFAEAAALPLGDLAAQLMRAGAGRDNDLKLSTLEAGNAALRQMLIELQGVIECDAAPWAQALNAQIWRLLSAGAAERALVMPAL